MVIPGPSWLGCGIGLSGGVRFPSHLVQCATLQRHWRSSTIRDQLVTFLARILCGYAAGAFSAMLAGLLWAPMPIRSALEGLLALGAAPIGLLAIAAAAWRKPNMHRIAVARFAFIIVFSGSVYVIFLATQARGIGPFAADILPN